MSTKSTNKGKSQTTSVKWLYVFPICLIPFISLLVKGHSYSTGLGKYSWFGSDSQVDFFLYYKMFAIIAVTIIMAVVLVIHIMQEKPLLSMQRKDWIQWCPLFVYLVFSFISTIMSKYSYFGFHGGYEQFESVWVILGYGMIAFYVFQFSGEKINMEKIMGALLIAVGIIALIGAFQFFSLDFFTLDFVKKLISPDGKGNLAFAFEKNRSYTTLYNPNYVGVFAVLILPVTTAIALFSEKKWLKILGTITSGLVMISLIGAKSKSGILVMLVLFLIMIFLCRKLVQQHKKIAGIVIGVVILCFSAVLILKGSEFITEIKNAFQIQKSVDPVIESFQTNQNDVTLTYLGNTIHFQYNLDAQVSEDFLTCTDDAGNQIDYTLNEENNSFTITDSRFEGITVTAVQFSEDRYGISVWADNKTFYFSYSNKLNKYQFYTPTGKYVSVNGTSDVPVFQPLSNYPTLASGRGFLWSRTIPMVKQHILLGSGADSFTLVYPNNEYMNMWNNGYYGMVVTKPHSMYLQIAVQEGLLAALAFVVFWMIYAISGLKLLWRSKLESWKEKMNIGILAGTIGFMVMGLTNDSSIGVTPLFFLLVGIGIRLNYDIKKERESHV